MCVEFIHLCGVVGWSSQSKSGHPLLHTAIVYVFLIQYFLLEGCWAGDLLTPVYLIDDDNDDP